MKKCILCGYEGDTYFCEKCGGRMEKSSDAEEIIVENTEGLKDLNYLNVTLVFLAILVAIKLLLHGTFQWKVIVLAVIAKSIEVFISKKKQKLPSSETRNLIMQLICLCISFTLLFTIDSYYRYEENPYMELERSGQGTTVAKYEWEYKFENEYRKEIRKDRLIVSEYNNTEFGDYYQVNYPYGYGFSFRVFKEEGIEYETPIIVEGEDLCKLIIKRKGLTDLVYVFPYYSSEHYMESKDNT